jgi:DNA-binding NtrC family response regulator
MRVHRYERKRRVETLIESILIVDDDAEVRKMLSTILGEEGYSVETAENGKQALKTCEKLPFDVAFIDVDLPDIKGTELLHRLKEIQPKMVKIIITGHPSIENAMKAVNEKAEGYVLKPFNVAELLEMIKKLLAEKTNEYFQMFTEVERAKENTPLFKYQHPEKR